MPPVDLGFGAAVRALRARAGLSLHELARRADVDPAYVHRIESPAAPRLVIPRRPVVVAIGRALGLDPVELDDLLARAGYVPEAVLGLGGWDHTLAVVAGVLADPALPAPARAEFRELLHLLTRRWARPPAPG